MGMRVQDATSQQSAVVLDTLDHNLTQAGSELVKDEANCAFAYPYGTPDPRVQA